MSHMYSTEYAPLCVCGHWSATGPQLKPRDKNIIAVSAGRKRIRVLQIGPFPNLDGANVWNPCSFTLSDEEDSSEVVGRGSSGKSTEHCLKRRQIKTEGRFSVIHTVFLHRQFINDIPRCQWQTQSQAIHSTLPWILFFFFASEEGSW